MPLFEQPQSKFEWLIAGALLGFFLMIWLIVAIAPQHPQKSLEQIRQDQQEKSHNSGKDVNEFLDGAGGK